MEKIFREEGLPVELTRLPFVESSFNVNARSKVGASGIWQFMPRTGRAYMRVARDVDERNDPLIATRASARVFKQNYMMLESWPLAVTGYNHGAFGVKNITRKLGTNDLAEIVEKYSSRSFGFASENFYACFLAALAVEKEAGKYFSDPRWSGEIETGELKLTRSMPWKTLLDFYDGDSALAALLNPHFTALIRKSKSQIPRGATVRVPVTRESLAKEFDAGKIPSKKLAERIKSVPMPPDIYSDDAVLDANQAIIRAKIEEPSAAANVLIPALVPPTRQSTSGAESP
jgi:membrane-bound lytic murein transglycosylase D